MQFLKNFFIEEEGQDMVEYGLVIALVIAGGVTAFGAYTGTLQTAFNTLGGKITNAL